jgi:hypothetical protein
MASAEELRQFATARFLQESVDAAPDEEDSQLWSVYRLVPEEISGNLIDSAMRSVGAVVEREGWHSLGARLGYLNDPQPIDDGDRDTIRSVLNSPEVGAWPAWFRNFATLLLAGTSTKGLWSDIPVVEPEMIPVFQAAMVLAGGLRDRYISRLQLFLQGSDSPLDNQPGKADAEMVFVQFENDPEQNPGVGRVIPALPQCVAGFFKLIEIMASFDDLFADVGEFEFGNTAQGFTQVPEVYPGSAGRFAIARATANLVTWRLNLRDQRTVNRLAVVMDAFWNICELQLRQHLPPGVRWSSTGSYDALIATLERWRDRADPEPDVNHIGLSQFKRSDHLALGNEAQPEGLTGF